MPTISEVALLSDESQKGEVFGIVKPYNVNNPSKPEASADRILSITYPARPLSQALKAIAERLSGKRAQGTYIFAGAGGTRRFACGLSSAIALSRKGRVFLQSVQSPTGG